ncbi:MAG: ABC transporter permease [Parvibaculaceae bacterium]|nr:ABC transporter permease [Parvibaculaceae bacterium]
MTTQDAASFTFDEAPDAFRLTVKGNWSLDHILPLDDGLRSLVKKPPETRKVVIDLGDVSRLDTAGAWLLFRTASGLAEQEIEVSYENVNDRVKAIYDQVSGGDPLDFSQKRQPPIYIQVAARMGDAVIAAGREFIGGLAFFGEVLITLGRAIRSPGRLRLTPLIHHMEMAGFDALPLVCLLTFLVGAVLAQQGATQLTQFGAQVFTVNLVAIAFLREVGVLLTAIIVAGRSGSAFTAEIGSMKTREEIDAMRTLGLDPMEMLVLPRVLALVFTLPMLTFAASMMGLLGGAFVSVFMLDMTPAAYLSRVKDVTGFWTFMVGILKAPFMALVISLIGCRSGLSVTGSAESVGQETTRSVVRSIFMVIVLDALFAMFFSKMGI